METVPLAMVPRNMIFALVNDKLDKDNLPAITIDDIFVVWFCKTLQNWKALVSTTLPDDTYYEVTFDGDKNQVYIDTYRKIENKAYDFVNE